MVLIIES